tara:strand:- start:393 stop:638 length:246 start_codon:yes stop_codon:yes gene_type:complete
MVNAMEASGRIWIIELLLAIPTNTNIKARKNETNIFPMIGIFLKDFEYNIKNGQLIKMIRVDCVFKKNESVNAINIIDIAK